MKKVIFILAFLCVCISSEAQKFLRYQMNNNTYNGFYTKNIESIIHDDKDGLATAFVHASGKIYEIPISDIDYISIEDACISNDNIGEYRIYEFTYEEGDVKKIYVDNRASLFASHNGDFGANDTILFSSAYNEIAWVIYTDNQGRIKKLFDGNRLFYFDYDSEDEFTTLDLSTNESNHYSLHNVSRVTRYRAPSSSQVSSFFSNLSSITQHVFNTGNDLANNINDIANNPEFHNQSLIIDGVSVAGDIAGIIASLLGEVPTAGLTTAGLVSDAASLLKDLIDLLNHLWPDSEQMNRYKEYYRNKYSITIKTIDPENVKSNKADIRGTFMSFNGVRGNLYFTFHKLADTGMGDKITGSTEAITTNSYIVKGSATNLKPGTTYFYMLWYECVVDGLHFTYAADNGIDFTTPKPSATTIGKVSVEDKSAVVKCSYSNVPEGAKCGVQYGYGGNSNIETTSSSDGEKTVSLTGLKPSTTYNYRAFIQYEGENYFGETKSFTTDLPDISGSWNCKEIHYDNAGNPQYKTYYLILGKDGKVQYSESGEIYSSSWSFKRDGTVTVSIMDLATPYSYSGKDWEGTVDNIENPTKISGSTSRWNYNEMVGTKRGDGYSFEMTR